MPPAPEDPSSRRLAALQALRRATGIDPHLLRAWLATVEVLHDLDRDREALVAADRAVAEDPGSARAWIARATALNRMERNEEALAAADHAVELEPIAAGAHHERAFALMGLGMHDEAADAFRDGNDVVPLELAVGIEDPYPWRRRFEDALAETDDRLAATPEDAGLWCDRGRILMGLADHESFLLEARTRLASSPDAGDEVVAWGDLAFVLTDLGRDADAEEAAHRAIAIDADHVVGWMALAQVLGAAGRHAEALTAEERVADIVPDDPGTWERRGELLERLGREDDAREAFERAFDLEAEIQAESGEDDDED
jgi:tetratricopeptide (TPR) repeat protein